MGYEVLGNEHLIYKLKKDLMDWSKLLVPSMLGWTTISWRWDSTEAIQSQSYMSNVLVIIFPVFSFMLMILFI